MCRHQAGVQARVTLHIAASPLRKHNTVRHVSHQEVHCKATAAGAHALLCIRKRKSLLPSPAKRPCRATLLAHLSCSHRADSGATESLRVERKMASISWAGLQVLHAHMTTTVQRSMDRDAEGIDSVTVWRNTATQPVNVFPDCCIQAAHHGALMCTYAHLTRGFMHRSKRTSKG